MDALSRHLEHICAVTGASSAAAYAPVRWASGSPLLVHVGRARPLDELATPEAAQAFAADAAVRLPQAHDAAVTDTHVARAGKGLLIRIPLPAHLCPTPLTPVDRRQAPPPMDGTQYGWIGLRFDGPRPDTTVPAFAAAGPFAGALAAAAVSLFGVLGDPLTALPGRHELETQLRTDLQRASAFGRSVGLVLANPLGLDVVNTAHGREAGDRVLREVVAALRMLVSRPEAVIRYGAAIFALPVGHLAADQTVAVAERLRAGIEGRTFLDGAIRLRCAVGAVVCPTDEAGAVDPFDLLQRATDALGSARDHDGARVVLWQAAAPTPTQSPDRLLGIFTGRADKDYRNMGLLWDVLRIVSEAHGAPGLAGRVAASVSRHLGCSWAGVFLAHGDGPRLLAGCGVDGEAATAPPQGAAMDERLRAFVAAASSQREPRERLLPVDDRHARAVVVPLVVGDTVLGAIGLLGSPDTFEIDRTDLAVLAGVAGQVAVALDHQRLAEHQHLAADRERRRLHTEVEDLRSALRHGGLVFQSPKMEQLLDRARRAAASETTVLITGESGTGKELLAQTVHRLSARRTRPFVIVDCGAIPPSLIDSTLFGHERGAFTGAQSRALGRLVKADGGTVFLDEIGELPLDVQSRLLRFVQEKTITAVGGTLARQVDVRIIAATNRRLEEEVQAGRFREDLFYRLNVVRLHVPPLRERPEDVRLLARHFARACAAEQGKSLAGFSEAAEQRLVEHAWPGNVRELQNTVLQAVVLAEGPELQVDDLTLPTRGVAPVVEADVAVATEDAAGATSDATAVAAAVDEATAAPWCNPLLADAGAAGGARAAFDEAWGDLHAALHLLVREATAARPRLVWPIGRWLATDLTLAVHDSVRGCRAEAAERLGLPPTTYARHLQKAQVERASAAMPARWTQVRDAVVRLAAVASPGPGTLARDVEALLLEVVATHALQPLSFSAGLMDWSTPTLKRRLAAWPVAAAAG